MKKTVKNIINYFNHLNMKIRHQLSHWPIFYAFIGSIGVVLIWRGVWKIADDINMPAWVSLFLGVGLSIATGLFVSFFVGDEIIISGIKHEKRVDEKTESEIQQEEIELVDIRKDLKEIKKEIEEM